VIEERILKSRVVAVCRSFARGLPKNDIGAGFLEKGLGLNGDAHSGTEKQVSLLLKEMVDRLSAQSGIIFPPGAFAENLLVEGLDPAYLQPGTCLKVGNAVLQIQRIGKDPGAVPSYSYLGYSLLTRWGIFASVLASGRVQKGDEVALDSCPD